MYNQRCLLDGANMARTAKKPTQQAFVSVKSIVIKDPDTKYYGEEPEFTLQPNNRTVALMKGFTWYNRFLTRKEAKDFLCQYVETKGKSEDSKVMRRIDENELIPTLGWLARMSLRGLELNEHETLTLKNEIARLIRSVHKPELKQKSQTGKNAVEKTVVKARPNVQEIMKDKAREAAGELEGLFDEFIQSGAKTIATKTMDELTKKNVLPQHTNILVDIWNKKLDEFLEVQKGKSDLAEGYTNLSKVQVKNIIKYIEQVISDLNAYVNVKKAQKAPRKRKAVPVEKLVSKLKFQKEFKDPASKLDLVSIHPTKLHGASEAWVYDTAKRKLHHYIADEYSKTFSVKGNTLLGFCTKQSEVKTLRKPSEQLKEVVGSKPAARKYFKDIKAVSVAPTGRFSETMIILKAF